MGFIYRSYAGALYARHAKSGAKVIHFLHIRKFTKIFLQLDALFFFVVALFYAIL